MSNNLNRYIIKWRTKPAPFASYSGTDTVYAESDDKAEIAALRKISRRDGFNVAELEITEIYHIKPVK